MKIMIVAQDYIPTRIASTVRLERMAKTLAKKHQVTIVTGFPIYNQKSLPKEYRGKFKRKVFDGKIKIYQTYTFFSLSDKFLPRFLTQLSFMFSSFWVGLSIKADLILTTSPPLFAAFSGAALSFFKGTKFVLDIRDLWPESMIILGVLKNKVFIFGAKIMEYLVYRRADVINVVTPNILRELQKKLPDKTINLLINATDTSYFKPKKVAKEKYDFKESEFIVLYMGNFGRAQALDKVLKSAKTLEGKNIKFLFVGKGNDEARLRKIAKSIQNVKFLEYQPKEKILDLINIADVCLIPLAKKKLFEGAIPSKTFEYLACQKAVIASAKGDLEKLIINNKTGLVVPPEDPSALTKAIKKLYFDKDLKQKIGLEGRKMVLEKYSEKIFSLNFEKTIQKVTL